SYTSSNILLQAATSMLSQANSMPQSVMTLLQNIG
ncbi:flagellin, partial [Ligilactobacillus agilis]